MATVPEVQKINAVIAGGDSIPAKNGETLKDVAGGVTPDTTLKSENGAPKVNGAPQNGNSSPNTPNNNRKNRGNRGGGNNNFDRASGSDARKLDGKFPQSSGGKPDEKKFSTRCRLFVGNLSADTKLEDVRKMFEKFTDGGAPDVYYDPKKMFGFVRLDTRYNAERAKDAIDGMNFKGRLVRVRFASQSAGIKVKNLGPNVCNELLERAFGKFGDIDKAVVAVDEKGKPCGEGIVYFAKRPSAMQAIHRVNEGIFLLGASPRPVVVEMLEEKDVEDGMAEIHIANRREYQNEISEQPHFAAAGSLEHEFGMRWKMLLEARQAQQQNLDRKFQIDCEELEKEMEKSIEDFEINKIKQTIALETQKMRQLEEKKLQAAQRRSGGPMNHHQQPHQQQQQQQQHRLPSPQQNNANVQMMIQQQQRIQQEMQQQSQQQQGIQVVRPMHGMPPVAPPGFGLPVGGMGSGLLPLRIPGQGGPFMGPGGPGAGMLGLPPLPNVGGGGGGFPGQPRFGAAGQFGNAFDQQQQQHFGDPNTSAFGQRQSDFDYKRGGDGRGGNDHNKRLRN
ncbi:Non-POU domain-containing octamer-binding protein [Hypsibius exemplaris]|uniref:Non-POU domain-containing octamer-binding protein n=1 Tax=Hypsibius exemplaris TaxID=2072580 RepID=A0A1W0WW53_HYPEX|nr:Non-POU domain-containing octamer-binding protein [Hypsibius exemplaris]